MKRRSADVAKLRRPLKKSRLVDGMYGSTCTYLKMVLLWTAVLMCDFMFELRFEYFWPFWMFARSVYDSFRYQGLAFSLLFVLMTITSDMVCYIFIPLHWLFLAASTYVWVQYVWHAERGICLPTISLWILFIYIEASLRLKDEKHLFFHADFSRPFAAHCVGYPAISLGFSFKSYVGHRFRQRRQTLVTRRNDLMIQLLQQALPPDITFEESPERQVILETLEETISNGAEQDASPKANRKSADEIRTTKYKLHSGSICGEIEYIEQRRSSVNEFDESEDKEKNYKNCYNTQRSSRWVTSCPSKEKRSRVKETPVAAVTPSAATRDDGTSKLELEVRRLRTDLGSSRQTEQELRAQVAGLVIQERDARNQLQLVQLDNDTLQAKVRQLVAARQQESQAVVLLEKRVADERKLRQAAEAQLQTERKKVSAATEQTPKCTDQCKLRRRELEAETRQLRRDNRHYEDRVRTVERELQSLHEVKETQSESDVLMSALTAMQDKNRYLEQSLSSETRHKMDLVAALGDAKRELEISKSQLSGREREIGELNARLADVLSVMPAMSAAKVPVSADQNGYSADVEPYPAASPALYELNMPPETPAKSQLDPNAAAYTPKMA